MFFSFPTFLFFNVEKSEEDASSPPSAYLFVSG